MRIVRRSLPPALLLAACAAAVRAADASAPAPSASGAWAPSAFTDPSDYKEGSRYRLVVRSLADGPALLERGDGDRIAGDEARYYESRLRALVGDPQTLADTTGAVVSASLIGPGRSGTFGACGVILSVPPENIVAAEPGDMAAFRTIDWGAPTEAQIARFRERHPLPAPDDLLARTEPGGYNELLVRVRSPGGGRVAVTGFFAKTSAGRPVCSKAMFALLSEAARRNRLPLIALEDGAAARPAEREPAGPPELIRPDPIAAPSEAARRAGIVWIPLPGGTFAMGDARSPRTSPVHRVALKPFAIAKTPVTNAQYRACVAAGACTPLHDSDGTCDVRSGGRWAPGILPASFRGDDQPAVCLVMAQALAFCRWIGGRLPTEAEWEYAARSAGRERRYPWGDEPADCGRAVVDDGGPGCGRGATWPVCSKPEGNTAQGVCDMAGEVWEWVRDDYHDSYDGAPAEGGAWRGPGGRVRRGGSWDYGGSAASAEERRRVSPVYRGDALGFRPARSL